MSDSGREVMRKRKWGGSSFRRFSTPRRRLRCSTVPLSSKASITKNVVPTLSSFPAEPRINFSNCSSTVVHSNATDSFRTLPRHSLQLSLTQARCREIVAKRRSGPTFAWFDSLKKNETQRFWSPSYLATEQAIADLPHPATLESQYTRDSWLQTD